MNIIKLQKKFYINLCILIFNKLFVFFGKLILIYYYFTNKII